VLVLAGLGVWALVGKGPPPAPAPGVTLAPAPSTPSPAPTPAPGPSVTPEPEPPAPPVAHPALVKVAPTPARRPPSPKPKPAAPVSTEPVKVSVVSRISGKSSYAELFVDGRRVGETPTMVELTPGAHRIRLVRDGYQTYEERVDFAPGRNERVAVDLHP